MSARGLGALRSVGAGACVFLALLAAGPAPGDDATPVLDKLRAAVRSARSFTVLFIGPLQNSISWTVVQPDRIRRVMTMMGPQPNDWIVIGHQSYDLDEDRRWHTKWQPGEAVRYNEILGMLRTGATARALPDRNENGTVMGAVDILAPENPLKNPIPPYHEICTYDKTTYRLHVCTNEGRWGKSSMTYENWDDPRITVQPPPGVLPPTAPPSPQPSS